jgi:hypothetical protein
LIYSVETTYGINSVISKLMTFVDNAETGQFLFMIIKDRIKKHKNLRNKRLKWQIILSKKAYKKPKKT